MQTVKLICVGKMKERYFAEAFGEYAKRLGAYCRFEWEELPEQRLPEKPSVTQIRTALEKEAEEIEKRLPRDAYIVALCVEGREIPSEGMAELIMERENSGRPKLVFLIGGSYGLADCIKSRANCKISLSKMTFPHHLARVMLSEQLYRGYKIKEGARYHK